jgi:hypothetical protein
MRAVCNSWYMGVRRPLLFTASWHRLFALDQPVGQEEYANENEEQRAPDSALPRRNPVFRSCFRLRHILDALT